MTQKKITSLTVNIPAEIKEQLQIIAIKEHTNMTDIVVPLITNYVKSYKKQ